MITLRSIFCSLLPLALLLVACDDSEQKKKERQSLFTSSNKPDPKPDMEPLESLIRTDIQLPSDRGSKPRFELYSQYAGADIRQVTGVSGRALILCFAASWCPHSQKMLEYLKTLAQEEKGTLQVVVVDADEHEKLAHSYNLTRVPTSYLYVEGVEIRRIDGTYSVRSLRKFLRNILTAGEEQTLLTPYEEQTLTINE